MSRDFKLKFTNGFTSPKQPSFRDSQCATTKPPTFLSLTQTIKHIIEPTNTQKTHQPQILKKSIDLINSQTHYQEYHQNFGNNKAVQLQKAMTEKDRLVSLQKQQQSAKCINIFSLQTRNKKRTQIQQKILNKAIKILQKALKDISFRLKKSSFKGTIKYTKNKQSLRVIAMFKEHCAIIIQKNFKRYIAQKYYHEFQVFVRRIKPSINAFQLGWKLRKIMKTKQIAKIIKDIKSKTTLQLDKEARILKREMSFQINRLIKGNKWLSDKQQSIKFNKQMISSRSLLLDKTIGKDSIYRQLSKETSKANISNYKQSIPQITEPVFNAWDDIPIKPSKQTNKNQFLGLQNNSYANVPQQIPKKQKLKKVIKKTQVKTQIQPLDNLQKEVINNLQIRQVQQKEQTKKIQQKPQSNTEKEKDKEKDKQNPKLKSKQIKSQKQILLEKRTKYDPRKAALSSRTSQIIPINRQDSQEQFQNQHKISQHQKKQTDKSKINSLRSIKQIPKKKVLNKRNILPSQQNIADYEQQRQQKIQSHSAYLAQRVRQKHIGIVQLENVFNSTYDQKMTLIVQKLKRINRCSLKDIIPSMNPNSRFLRKYQPKHFYALQSQIIDMHK